MTNGEINSGDAHCIVLTTTASEAEADALARFITAHHAYETPEIVQVPVTAGLAAYLCWLDDETKTQA